jgi:capsular polysaccharide biosynthesis protein
MSIHDFLKLIGKKKQTIVSLLAIFLAVVIVFSAAQPFRYNSNLKLLTIINFKENVDPYTASRSNEYLSNLLARIVVSGSFFEKIKESGFNIDKNYFSGSEKKQMKKWGQTVKTKSVADTGMISVDVYHTDRAQAEEIAKAVAYTLQTTNSQYHGFGSGVEIKIIDDPLTSNYPVLPSVPLNLGLAVAFAVIFFLCYIYLFPEEKYDIRLWPKRKNNFIEEPGLADDRYAEPVFAPARQPVCAETEADESANAFAVAGEEEERASFNGYRPEDFQNNGSMDNILRK